MEDFRMITFQTDLLGDKKGNEYRIVRVSKKYSVSNKEPRFFQSLE